MKQIYKYMEQHQYCEACGSLCSGLPHHIKTQGAGGTDKPENLLRLCCNCHRLIHDKGDIWFIRAFPWVYNKISQQKSKAVDALDNWKEKTHGGYK